MGAFALYRLPRDCHFTLVEQTEGEPQEFVSLAELNGKQGFVVAPFAVSAEQPILLIRPDCVKSMDQLDATVVIQPTKNITSCPSRNDYHSDFANYHAHLLSGDFKKIVLARSAYHSPLIAHRSPLALFQDACRRYPRMFICLVFTSKSGAWLTATPEVLLSKADNRWQTMALAGTMKLEGDLLNFDTSASQSRLHIAWTDKNIQEQRYVATYITECLERFATDFTEHGPYTVRAGDLVHLRSDFRFTLPDEQHLGDVLCALHPTPAVCGLPKKDAYDFILQNEHSPRSYYSGFMGPLQMSLNSHFAPITTHLYVSLRCMQLLSNGYLLYAGGGLLPDSVEEQEWQETEAKMETMRNLLYI